MEFEPFVVLRVVGTDEEGGTIRSSFDWHISYYLYEGVPSSTNLIAMMMLVVKPKDAQSFNCNQFEQSQQVTQFSGYS